MKYNKQLPTTTGKVQEKNTAFVMPTMSAICDVYIPVAIICPRYRQGIVAHPNIEKMPLKQSSRDDHDPSEKKANVRRVMSAHAPTAGTIGNEKKMIVQIICAAITRRAIFVIFIERFFHPSQASSSFSTVRSTRLTVEEGLIGG